jgi:broad specificity phosphatase PhoE
MIVFIRHGERADQSKDPQERKLIETSFDPHLTKVGIEQAKESGKFIAQLLSDHAKRFNTVVEPVHIP